MMRALRAVLAGPVLMAGIVPGVLLWLTGSIHVGWGSSWATPVAGVLLALGGIVLVVHTVVLFAKVGRGTLAPWDPPRRLVVRGPYRRVRNPMISGVFFLLAGESVFFGSWVLACWTVVWMSCLALYIHGREEPALRRRFGDDYLVYCAAVPPWIPRLRKWTPTW